MYIHLIYVDIYTCRYRVYAAGKGIGASVHIWQQIMGKYLASLSISAGLCASSLASHTTADNENEREMGATQKEERAVSEGVELGDVTMRLIEHQLVQPFRMGKLGNANRNSRTTYIHTYARSSYMCVCIDI